MRIIWRNNVYMGIFCSENGRKAYTQTWIYYISIFHINGSEIVCLRWNLKKSRLMGVKSAKFMQNVEKLHIIGAFSWICWYGYVSSAA